MTCFEQFLEPIELAEKVMGGGYEAYKMDKDKDGMRHFVGLGECNCFDYFLPHKKSIVLIEETRFSKTMQGYRDAHDYLKRKDKKAFAAKRMRDEIRLKAYGSMLVLWRLTEKCQAAKDLFQNKKYCFWIVESDTSVTDLQAFDSIRDDSQNMLRGALSTKVVDTVKLLLPEDLKDKLSSP